VDCWWFLEEIKASRSIVLRAAMIRNIARKSLDRDERRKEVMSMISYIDDAESGAYLR